MENVVSAAGKGDLHACKAALRVALSPALVAEVAALVEAGGGGNAAGSLACIQYFLKCGACLDARKEDGGKTVLMIAAKAGRADAVGAMLEHWGRVDTEGDAVDVYMEDGTGHTAHHYASTLYPAKFTPEILQRLSGSYDTLLSEIAKGNVAAVKTILDAEPPSIMNTKNADNDTVLMIAVQSGLAGLPMITAILEAGGQDILDVALETAALSGKSGILSALRGLEAPSADLPPAKRMRIAPTPRRGGGGGGGGGGAAAAAAAAGGGARGGGGGAAAGTASAGSNTVDSKTAHSCPIWKRAKAVVDSWGLPPSLFKPGYDMCYCGTACECHDPAFKKSTRGKPPKEYAFPIGWCRFALTLPAGENSEMLARKHVSFHGTRLASAQAILNCSNPQLLMPGTVTERGFRIPIRGGHIAAPAAYRRRHVPPPSVDTAPPPCSRPFLPCSRLTTMSRMQAQLEEALTNADRDASAKSDRISGLEAELRRRQVMVPLFGLHAEDVDKMTELEVEHKDLADQHAELLERMEAQRELEAQRLEDSRLAPSSPGKRDSSVNDDAESDLDIGGLLALGARARSATMSSIGSLDHGSLLDDERLALVEQLEDEVRKLQDTLIDREVEVAELRELHQLSSVPLSVMLKLADAAGGIPDEEEIEMLKRKAAREEAAEKEQLAIAALASAGTASNGGGSGGGAATASGGGRNGDKLPDSFHSAISDSGDEGDSSAANEYRAVNSLFEELSGLDGSIDERTDSLMYPLRGGELPKVTEPAEDQGANTPAEDKGKWVSKTDQKRLDLMHMVTAGDITAEEARKRIHALSNADAGGASSGDDISVTSGDDFLSASEGDSSDDEIDDGENEFEDARDDGDGSMPPSYSAVAPPVKPVKPNAWGAANALLGRVRGLLLTGSRSIDQLQRELRIESNKALQKQLRAVLYDLEQSGELLVNILEVDGEDLPKVVYYIQPS
eukprot:gene8855-13368_t